MVEDEMVLNHTGPENISAGLMLANLESKQIST